MVDQFPQPYSTISPTNAVFDFTEFSSGVSVVSYQCYNSQITTTADHHMNSNNIHSDAVETVDDSTGFGTGSAAKTMDLDFDTAPFTFPQTLDGTSTVNVTAGFLHDAGAQIDEFYIIAKIRRWDGSTETDLGSGQSRLYQASSANSWVSSNFTIPITITDELIAEGQTLRLTIELWGNAGAAGASVDAAIGHSPFDLTGNIDPSTQDSNYNQTILNASFRRE